MNGPWPPPTRLEAITTHPEGGWIATGQCGRPHLVGMRWSWWVCPACRQLAADRITPEQRADMRDVS